MIPSRESAPVFNPFSAEFTSNPYPSYKRLREGAPVYSVRGCLGTDWVLSRYHDIRRVLMDATYLIDDLPVRIRRIGSPSEVESLCRFLERWLFFVNPPQHTALRAAVAPHFSKAAIDGLEQAIRKLAEDLVRPLLREGRIDVVRDLAKSLPCRVAAHMLGLPMDDINRIVVWSVDLFSVFVQPASLAHYIHLNRQTEQFREYFTARAGDSKTGLLSHLMSQSGDPDQALAFCMMLFSVGQETTQHLIGNSMLALLEHPEQMERARGRVSLGIIKELARYNTPVQMIIRRAGCDMEIDGHTIRADERLHLLLGSANHDEDVFPEPEKLDLARTEVSGLLFGTGPHVCLGMHVALLSAQIAIQTMLEQLDGLRLATRELSWIRSAHMRGLKTLPCLFNPVT
ncbi:MAG TPA: cytochrome P450 [Bryobacteraceae bacterium]